MNQKIFDKTTSIFDHMRRTLRQGATIEGMDHFLGALAAGRFYFEKEQWHDVGDDRLACTSATPCEYLLRAKDEEGGPIAQEDLIRAISVAGLQSQFDVAIALAAVDQAIGRGDFPLSINVSAHAAADPYFWVELHDQLQFFFADQYDPRQVIFELTEDDACDFVDVDSLQKMQDVHGYRFAIDDLSHTDLRRLQQLGPHVAMVKIDGKSLEAAERGEFSMQDFVKGIKHQAQNAAVLVEWVKSPEQAKSLRDIFAIDYVSGRDLSHDPDYFKQCFSQAPAPA